MWLRSAFVKLGPGADRFVVCDAGAEASQNYIRAVTRSALLRGVTPVRLANIATARRSFFSAMEPHQGISGTYAALCSAGCGSGVVMGILDAAPSLWPIRAVR